MRPHTVRADSFFSNALVEVLNRSYSTHLATDEPVLLESFCSAIASALIRFNTVSVEKWRRTWQTSSHSPE